MIAYTLFYNIILVNNCISCTWPFIFYLLNYFENSKIITCRELAIQLYLCGKC